MAKKKSPVVAAPLPVIAIPQPPLSSSSCKYPSLLLALLALALGLFLSESNPAPLGNPPDLLPTTPARSKPSNTLTPSSELARGLPDTMQSKLYGGRAATLVVLNDMEGNDWNRAVVWWSGRVRAVAPAKSWAMLETYVNHEFKIVYKNKTTEVVVDAPYVVYRVNPVDGTVEFVPGMTAEEHLPKIAFPPPPKSVKLTTTAKAIKVRNLSNRRFHEFWVPGDPNTPIVYQGVIEPNSETTTNSYIGHTFRFADIKDKKNTVFEFSVKPDQEIYAYIDEATADNASLKSHIEELAFGADYKKRHNGRPWLSFYPHEPAKSFMWPADYIGQVHYVETPNGPGGKLSNITLRVTSTRPRSYVIENFLSDEEADFIVASAKNRLGKSSVEMHDEHGNRIETATRTSKNAWLERDVNGTILDILYRRVSDVLLIPDQIMHQRSPDGCAESMQVVNYKKGAHYAPHHDWGVRGSPHTRFATFLLYLNDVKTGGETAFPKAQVGNPDGLAIKPKKGQAALFYSQFPDGNVDDESLHEAKPVIGNEEKWLANVWVHDMAHWRQ